MWYHYYVNQLNLTTGCFMSGYVVSAHVQSHA
jgi:hypothetical protein